MSFRIPRLPLPLNGLKITSSASSGGIPINDSTGDNSLTKKALTPEIFMISINIKIATKNGKIEINSHLEVSAKPTEYSGNIAFTKYELITTVNDKEIDREDITATIEDGNHDSQFNKTIDAGLGDKAVIYVEAVDSLGYIHRTVVFSWYKNEDGAVAEAMYDGDSIYDKDGNLLSVR